ncbi:MAG: DUF167 domain-containing protein [Treponema sp.]|jgi:uncharacterized protein (TIGR00251 family)|nr:DUF167 domain-containing protein [Treponema sp.]
MTEKDRLSEEEGVFRLTIKALPGASKTEIAGVKDGFLRVRIAAAPEDGKANAELRAFLARILGCSKGEVVLLRGERSRFKTLALPARCREKAESLGDKKAPGV